MPDAITETKRRKKLFIFFLSLSAATIVLLYLAASQLRFFDNDEFEHLHNAWLMAEGVLPISGAGMLHAPMLEWSIILLMKIFGESILLIRMVRLFIFIVAALSLFFVYLISRKLYQSNVKSFFAVLLTGSNLAWMYKTPEIRPDFLMMFFALLSFLILMSLYKKFSFLRLIAFAGALVLSFLGKQNAAVFTLAVGLGFCLELLTRKKMLPLKYIIIAAVAAVIVFELPPVQNLLKNNMRHLIPHENRFSPVGLLQSIWKFNPAVFIFFFLQLFSPLKTPDHYRSFKIYVPLTGAVCFIFLFIMNRPFMQEMLLMTAFMSIYGSCFLGELVCKIHWKAAYAVLFLILLPVVWFIPKLFTRSPISLDLDVIEIILELTDRDEPVFDAYGRAVFRKHPLDPKFILYKPREFDRLDELKKSGTDFIIEDWNYFPRLPDETLRWIDRNFVRLKRNRNVWVRKSRMDELR